MCNCARPGCHTAAKSSCSGCGREQYCSSNCQKLDWKTHKPMCPILKKLSNKLQPYNEVVQTIQEVLVSKEENNVRALEHLLSYAEYQFGNQETGKSYRERINGERISNWVVDINILHNINLSLSTIYRRNHSLSTISRDNGMLPYLERSSSLLKSWLIHLDTDIRHRTDSINIDQTNHLLQGLINMEQNMAAVNINRRKFDIAESHCHQCLSYSRRWGVEGEEKITSMLMALGTYCDLREHQCDYTAAVTFAEEAYNLVVVAYDPVHPQVTEAAGTLIHILIANGDLFDAFRYSQITYSNLRDIQNGMDQEGEEVANGSYNLAFVIYRQKGDLIKAEEVVREALRIRTRIYGNDHYNVGLSCDLLASILAEQSKLGNETRGLFVRSLAIFIRNEGPDGSNTASANINIGTFYYKLAQSQSTADLKRTQLQLTISHFKEAFRINLKVHGPAHSNTVSVKLRLANILRELS